MKWSPINSRTSVTLVNNTAKTERVTVPAGEVWEIDAVGFKNGDDVARAVAVTVVDSSNADYLYLANHSGLAAADRAQYPHSKGATDEPDHLLSYPLYVAGGNKIQFYFAAGGASTGGTGDAVILGRKWRVPV